MTRRAILLKWILYCLCALALALLQGLVLVYVRVWGVHPFLLPAIAVIPATLERNEQALLYAVFFGWCATFSRRWRACRAFTRWRSCLVRRQRGC